MLFVSSVVHMPKNVREWGDVGLRQASEVSSRVDYSLPLIPPYVPLSLGRSRPWHLVLLLAQVGSQTSSLGKSTGQQKEWDEFSVQLMRLENEEKNQRTWLTKLFFPTLKFYCSFYKSSKHPITVIVELVFQKLL